MPRPSVVILGGGLAGMAAAYALGRAGYRDVTIVERGTELGGLAGTFRQGAHFYPLTYHHILHLDRTLLYFLDVIGVLDRVRWRRIRMRFSLNHRLFDLANPLDFLAFPMRALDKLRFARLMWRSFRKENWADWEDRSAAELIDSWAGPGVRRALFEPLTRLKFDLPCEEVSAAWLGARLYFREGSAPLGYVPGDNWTRLLCEGVAGLLDDVAVRAITECAVHRLRVSERRVVGAELQSGETLGGDVFVSALPTEVYRTLVPGDATPQIDSIRYTAILSMTCVTRQQIHPDFYWLNLASLDHRACALFMLSSLNPTIGEPGERCLNFVTHLPSRHDPTFRQGDEQLIEAYLADFRRLFGFELRPRWTRLSRLPMYSPVFSRGYRTPPVRSEAWTNLYFAGNHRMFPSIASTGTALDSGLEAARAILRDRGEDSSLAEVAQSFRLRSMPRG